MHLTYKKLQTLFEKNHFKMTSTKQIFLEILLKSNRPLKAYEILDTLKQYRPKSRPATVYRIIDILVQKQILHKIMSQNSFLLCTHPQTHRNCLLLICQKCHKVIENCEESILNNITQLVNKHQFLQYSATLQIQGVCHECT